MILFMDDSFTDMLDSLENTYGIPDSYLRPLDVKKQIDSQFKEAKKILKEEYPHNTCVHCGHKWVPIKKISRVCPKCQRTTWQFGKEPKLLRKEKSDIKHIKSNDTNIYLFTGVDWYEIPLSLLKTKELLLEWIRHLVSKKWVKRQHLFGLIIFCEKKFGYSCYNIK